MKDVIHLILAITGFSLLLWLVWIALKDMITIGRPQRKPIQNVLLVLLCLIYLVKIIVADLLPYLA
jgi:hypothetical protein